MRYLILCFAVKIREFIYFIERFYIAVYWSLSEYNTLEYIEQQHDHLLFVHHLRLISIHRTEEFIL